jgi:transcriptional regulator with XRE-family HTH domain
VLVVTFQQVQKYEKGRNRIGAGRLQHISHILHIPVAFLFDGSPKGEAPLPPYVSDFLTTAEGLTLVEAFVRIENPTLQRRIVELIEYVAAAT